MPDHIHLLISMGPRQAISDLVREIKTTSGEWINQHDSAKPANSGKFRWQEGYAVFSYHVSQKDMVYHYILHQEKHHNTMKLSEEFRYMMKDNEVDFNPQYAGEWLMDSD